MARPSIKKELAAWLAKVFAEAGCAIPAADIEFSFEAPREEKFGDLSTSVSLRLAKAARKAPRALADDVLKRLNESLPKSPLTGRIERFAVEGPGFINIYYSRAEISEVLLEIAFQKEKFGKPPIQTKKILLEFVSANPTGPLTVAHGRQAALGDSLARILRFCGHQVTAEYYNNDEGVQISTLGKSLFHRVGQLLKIPDYLKELPKEFYQGEYLIEIAQKFIELHGGEGQVKKLWRKSERSVIELEAECKAFARTEIMNGIIQDLKDFDSNFDNFYSEGNLYFKRAGQKEPSRVEKVLSILDEKGETEERDGAKWFKSTKYGDDKDRVLIKSDKTYTYLVPDIAYHDYKFERGFQMLVNIWGPDHHGYISRLKASQEALGHDPKKIHILIAQLVTLFESGQEVRMSTRAGQFVTLREILTEVGKDAGRFFFVNRKFDAHLDFDLALAKTQSSDNPVFYIQYAHARIESIKTKAHEEGVWTENVEQYLGELGNPAELRVLRLLLQFENTVLAAERTLEPYRLVPYLMELASAFHKFYADNRVMSHSPTISAARLALAKGVQQVIQIGLNLLGVAAPLKM